MSYTGFLISQEQAKERDETKIQPNDERDGRSQNHEQAPLPCSFAVSLSEDESTDANVGKDDNVDNDVDSDDGDNDDDLR